MEAQGHCAEADNGQPPQNISSFETQKGAHKSAMTQLHFPPLHSCRQGYEDLPCIASFHWSIWCRAVSPFTWKHRDQS